MMFVAKDVWVALFPFCELESFLVINFNCIVLSAGRRDRYLRECFRSCQIAFEKIKLILLGICTKAKVAKKKLQKLLKYVYQPRIPVPKGFCNMYI